MRAPLRPRDLIAVAVVSVFSLLAAGTHVVRSGESLSAIAAKNGTTVRALVEANGIKDPNLIVAGQSLRLPGGGGSGGVASSYVVEKGDTLAAIAKKLGTSVSALAQANNIRDPNRILVGSTLRVSGSGSGSGSGGGSPVSSGGGRQLPGQKHTVQRGETIYGIAARYGVAQADLVRWNGLVDGKLYAGARLLLFDPGSLPGSSATAGPTTHVVAAGENLGSIATRYGSTASAIARASGLADVNSIRVGQKLTVPAAGSSGTIRCPVPGATFMNDWGFARSGGRGHAGTDMFAARGAPVRAPVSGRVDLATGTIGGHQFRLRGADGTLWFGSHMDRFGKGGQVSAGDVIGYVGNSGNAKGGPTHLHFEVHPSGQAVNPYPLLRQVC